MATELKTWVSKATVTTALDSMHRLERSRLLPQKLDAALLRARQQKAEAGYDDLDEVAIDVDVTVRIYYNVEQEVSDETVAEETPAVPERGADGAGKGSDPAEDDHSWRVP